MNHALIRMRFLLSLGCYYHDSSVICNVYQRACLYEKEEILLILTSEIVARRPVLIHEREQVKEEST